MFIKELEFKTIDSDNNETLPNENVVHTASDSSNISIDASKENTTILISLKDEEKASEFIMECEMLFKIWCVKSTQARNCVVILADDLTKAYTHLYRYYQFSVVGTNNK